MSQHQFEKSLMRGCDPLQATQWIDTLLDQELRSAEKINPDLYQLGAPNNDFHELSKIWLIPEQYRSMDIGAHVLRLCRNQQDVDRVTWELAEFESKSLIPMLQSIKYVVDTLLENNILWGVGRGSSVCSLTLYLLGAHRIDPIKWNLDPSEFFR